MVGFSSRTQRVQVPNNSVLGIWVIVIRGQGFREYVIIWYLDPDIIGLRERRMGCYGDMETAPVQGFVLGIGKALASSWSFCG